MNDVLWREGRAFADYRKWECYRAGMYRQGTSPERTEQAQRLLADPPRFRDALLDTLKAWPVSFRVHLTDPHRNHQAYLGRVACCRLYHATEWDTQAAWWLLTPQEQRNANDVADTVEAQCQLIWTPEHFPSPSAQWAFPW